MEEPHMFVGIIAIQSGGTALKVCPKSHRTDADGEFQEVVLVELEKYEFIVCHPKLIHGGCGADEVNYRLHFYHGIPKQIALKTSFPPIMQKPREEVQATACAIAREAKTKSKNAIVKARAAAIEKALTDKE
jgi:hypothetical protein